MTNHCWHEIDKSEVYHLGNRFERLRIIICCNCGTYSNRIYKFEVTQLEGHGKYFAPETLVPKPVECAKECKND